MNISTSLCFDGRCEEAFKFYERALEGKIAFSMKWGESPMAEQAPPEWRGKIIHATFIIGGVSLSGGDVPPKDYKPPQGFSLMIGTPDVQTAERAFKALAEAGTVTVPLQETFWATRFGEVTDRYGIPWSINCEKPM
jgi:PhnB protein